MKKTYYVTRWNSSSGARRSSDMRDFGTIREARASLRRGHFAHDSGNAVAGEVEKWSRHENGDFEEPCADIELYTRD